ncbi:MAG TPA: exodeoxyribonuclease III [Acidimicrobiales bacterium]
MTARDRQQTHETQAPRRARRREQRIRAARERRAALSPAVPAPGHLRVATWNLNSLRPRLDAVGRFLERTAPDVVCLQETKTARLSDAAVATFERHGYAVAHAGGGAYNGVAVAARHPLSDVRASGQLGDEHLDREPRLVSGLVTLDAPGAPHVPFAAGTPAAAPAPVRVASVYVPHGRAVDHWHYEYKVGFLEALAEQVRRWREDDARRGAHLVVAGDVNVAATDSDVFHPDAYAGSVYVAPRVRQALARVLDAGLVDVDVARWGPAARRFTWWPLGPRYDRDLGMRLDVIAADRALAARLATTWIDHRERSAARPSDHAALVADFRLGGPEPGAAGIRS